MYSLIDINAKQWGVNAATEQSFAAYEHNTWTSNTVEGQECCI